VVEVKLSIAEFKRLIFALDFFIEDYKKAGYESSFAADDLRKFQLLRAKLKIELENYKKRKKEIMEAKK